MRSNYCGQHDCEDCYHLVEIGSNGIFICLRHKIQIVPVEGMKCAFWRWEEDGDIHYDDAMERSKQEDDQSLHHKE